MSIFKLPDLGEGLPDAEIHEWYVKVGDAVEVDQPLVSMETAKAVVDVPSPQKGIIKKLYGGVGDIIKTEMPLVEFEGAESKTDAGTVVGNIEASNQTLTETFTVGVTAGSAVAALAAKLNVNLATLQASRKDGLITSDDVQRAARHAGPAKIPTAAAPASALAPGYEPVRGPRRSMAIAMSHSHAEVVPVTLSDDADIHAWSSDTDITIRLIQAICQACKAEPALNSWYDAKSNSRKLHQTVNLGIAMDTGEALFVPVIAQADTKTSAALREQINEFKTQARAREFPPQVLKDATITLSNFGNFAGRYASPIIVPPMAAILAVGKLREAVVAHEGKPAIHRIIPLSVSFDHRTVTGGEAARFLKAVIDALEKA